MTTTTTTTTRTTRTPPPSTTMTLDKLDQKWSHENKQNDRSGETKTFDIYIYIYTYTYVYRRLTYPVLVLIGQAWSYRIIVDQMYNIINLQSAVTTC